MVIDAASSSPIENAGPNKVRKYLARADLVLANEDEFAALEIGAPENWTTEFQNLILKRGPRGALWLKRGQEVASVKAEDVKVIDTTGAGDAFCGGFLAGMQKTNDPLLAVLHGNVSASLKVEGTGPFYPLDVMPGLAEARLHALQEMAREVV
jgi:sugar/nucleoside kinase (ribokinase family)